MTVSHKPATDAGQFDVPIFSRGDAAIWLEGVAGVMPARTDGADAFRCATTEAEAFFRAWEEGNPSGSTAQFFHLQPLLDRIAAVVALPATELAKAVLLGADRADVVIAPRSRDRAVACAERALSDWPTEPTNPEGEGQDIRDLTDTLSEPPTFDLASEPGLLGDVARWCAAMAYRPVHEFALPAALATLAPLFGRRWATPTGQGLNLYLVGIAETGGGKDALVSAPAALLKAAGFRHLVGPSDFTSDAAIEAAVRMRPCQIMPLDEFGKLAQAITGRNAPAFAKLAAKALLELYPRSAPHQEWTGKQRAGDGRDSAGEPIMSPTLSIIGVSTPGGFFEGMTEATLDDGTLNRLTVVVAGKPGPRQKDPTRLAVPAALAEAIRSAYEAAGTGAGNLSPALVREASAPQTILPVRWADASAERAIEEVEEWEDEARDLGRGGICNRAAEQTMKVATIRALARDPGAAAVTADDVRWAWSFVQSSIAALERGARDHMASSAFEELVKGIQRVVEAAGPPGIPYSKLLEAKSVSKAEPRMVASALDRLKERGLIADDIGTTARGGRPGRRIRPLAQVN